MARDPARDGSELGLAYRNGDPTRVTERHRCLPRAGGEVDPLTRPPCRSRRWCARLKLPWSWPVGEVERFVGGCVILKAVVVQIRLLSFHSTSLASRRLAATS